jgi:hypothetical protein
MLFRQVDATYAELDFSNVCCVGVDEMPMRKGHEDPRVLADLVGKRCFLPPKARTRKHGSDLWKRWKTTTFGCVLNMYKDVPNWDR